jgi:hypothetical protein
MTIESKEAWLRKQALMIANQLPENTDDALMVLDLAKEFVREFLTPQRAKRLHSLRVVEIGGAVDADSAAERPATG